MATHRRHAVRSTTALGLKVHIASTTPPHAWVTRRSEGRPDPFRLGGSEPKILTPGRVRTCAQSLMHPHAWTGGDDGRQGFSPVGGASTPLGTPPP